MIKDEDICVMCFRRRQKRDCQYTPYGFHSYDGEWEICCKGLVSISEIQNSQLDDCLWDYHGVGDPPPWKEVYAELIYYGINSIM